MRYTPIFESKPETKFSSIKGKIKSLQDSGLEFKDGYIRVGNETFLMLNSTLTKVDTIANLDLPVYGSIQNIIDANKLN